VSDLFFSATALASRSLALISRFEKMGNSSKDDSATDGDTSSGDTPPSNSSLFSEGEKVLAYHGPRLYEAKVLPLPFSLLFLHFHFLLALALA
jgi:hypothetical protein